jgi:hypothetical protein
MVHCCLWALVSAFVLAVLSAFADGFWKSHISSAYFRKYHATHGPGADEFFIILALLIELRRWGFENRLAGYRLDIFLLRSFLPSPGHCCGLLAEWAVKALGQRMLEEESLRVVGGESVAIKRDRFAQMWSMLTQSEHGEAELSDFIRLAKLALTVVGTSVNDERAFSAMSFVKTPERNGLGRHLELAVRAKYQGQFTFQTFPTDEALQVC